MLFYISGLNKKPAEIEIYNRDLKKAKMLAKDFKFVKKVGVLEDLAGVKGDVLANVTKLGGSLPDDFFTKDIVGNFKAVADVTFETENTNLIKLAKKLGKKYATGWDMFTYQGQIVLETILNQKISAEVLRKHVVKGLSQTVK
jgi:shikimate 5-dehydrogenase